MLITVLKGIVTLFYNPLLYLLIAVLFLIGWQRVRRERLSFGIKVYGIFNTVLSTIWPSLLLALIGTIIFIGLGVAVPVGMVVLITICSFLLLLTGQLRYFTATLSVGLSIIIAFFLPEFQMGVGFADRWLVEIHRTPLLELGIILSTVLLLEAFAVLIWGKKEPSPRLVSSKRGRKVGAIEASHLWILPLFLLLPGSDGAIHAFSWWPFSSGQMFGICALPVGLGFQQFITHGLPRPAVRFSGLWLLITGVVVAVLTVLGVYFNVDLPILIAGFVAIISRISLIIRHFYDHAVKPFYFVDEGNGLKVVTVIPNTPADKMGVKMGEIISKVNGITIRTEDDFYQALQINATYCKMDVLNLDGEVHFVKGMVHENELHNIGLLFPVPSRRVKGLDEVKSES